MCKVIVFVLFVFPAVYLMRVVYLAIKSGKAEVKEGIIYRKNKQPIAYWIVIIVQSLIAILLLYGVFVINRLP